MEEDEGDYEILIKLVILGDTAVGKSNFLYRFVDGEFNPVHVATVGFDFKSRIWEMPKSKKRVKFQIWDTAGQEKYKAITGAYYKGSKGAFVVYDITRKETFASVERWVNDLKSTSDPKLTIILIGNKNDMEDQRQVTKEQGEEKAKSFGCAFLETSALSGDNLDKAFTLMVKEIFEKFNSESTGEEEDDSVKKGEDIKLEKTTENKKKSCC